MQCNICIIFQRSILCVSKCVNILNDYNDDIDLIGITFLCYQTSTVWFISNSLYLKYLKAATLMIFLSFHHILHDDLFTKTYQDSISTKLFDICFEKTLSFFQFHHLLFLILPHRREFSWISLSLISNLSTKTKIWTCDLLFISSFYIFSNFICKK